MYDLHRHDSRKVRFPIEQLTAGRASSVITADGNRKIENKGIQLPVMPDELRLIRPTACMIPGVIESMIADRTKVHMVARLVAVA